MVQLAEKDRALRMASKPLPPSQDIILNFAVGKGRRVRLTNVEGYSATYYHLAPEVAHRETPNRQEDAYKAADQIEDLMKQKEKATAREQEERDEKARLRHQQAYREIRLKQDYSDMMDELALLERADRLHRQKTLQQLPKRVFIPPHRQMEEAADLQREMERAFEEIAIQDEECHSELNRSLDRPTEAPPLIIHQPPPVRPPVDVSCAVEADVTDSNKVTSTDNQVSVSTGLSDESESPKVYQDKVAKDTCLQERFDPIQQLLERVRAQRQAWADYYQSRESAPVISQTSSETTADEEGTRIATEDHRNNSGKDHVIDVLGVGQQISGTEEVTDTDTEDSSATTAENDGQQHPPVKQPITTDLTQNNVTVNNSVSADRPDITDSHRETSQSESRGSTVSSMTSSSGHAVASCQDQPKTTTYRTPDALLQHILEQRKQYEEQRSMISSQYSRTTDTRSSIAGKVPAMDIVMLQSVSQQPCLLPQPVSAAVPTASTQHNSLFIHHRPVSVLSPFQDVPVPPRTCVTSSTKSSVAHNSHNVHVAAPTVELTHSDTVLDLERSSGLDVNQSGGHLVDRQSLKSSSLSESCHSVVDDVENPSTMIQTHLGNGNTDILNQGHKEDFNMQTTASTDRILGNLDDIDGKLLATSVSDHQLEQAAKNSDLLESNDSWSTASSSQPSDRPAIAPAASGSFVDHQHSPETEKFLPSSAACLVPIPAGYDAQHVSTEADEIREQVDMPQPIMLPSTGSHSPLSWDSGSLIDLSKCVDFSQMLREPGDGSHLEDLEESTSDREPDKITLQQQPVKPTATKYYSDGCEQRPWSFYLRTGKDPPQSLTSCHSLPDIQAPKDVTSNDLPFAFQHLQLEDRCSNNACVYSLQLEPDASYLQRAMKSRETKEEQSHTELLDSEPKDPQILAGQEESRSLSLQEAFAKHKQKFVTASETRRQQIPVKAKERERHVAKKRPTQRKTSTPLRYQGPDMKSLPAWEPEVHATRPIGTQF
jgi:hypothetical protein